MKTYVMVYDTFAHFEVILASYFLKGKGEIITFSINKQIVESCEGYKIQPDMTIDEIDIDEIDVFLLPGGNPEKLYKCKELYDLLVKLNDMGKTIGAVCSGPVHLAKAGILKDRKYTTTSNIDDFTEFDNSNYLKQNVVIDKNIITAQASGYVDFAIDIGKMLDIYEDETDYQETIEFFKYFKIFDD